MNFFRRTLMSVAKLGANTMAKLAYRTVQDAQLLEGTRRIFADTDPTMVLDVGGHYGNYRQMLRQKLLFQGPIGSFEPNPKLVEGLLHLSDIDSAWKIFPFALGNENGHLSFNIMESSSLSSFLEPTNENIELSGNALNETLDVPVRRLDALEEELSELGDMSRIFLKMDTQGFDYNVFTGARGLYDRIVAIQTEISIRPIYQEMPTYIQMLQLLDEHQYKPVCLSPTHIEKGKVVEFDCLLVKDTA